VLAGESTGCLDGGNIPANNQTGCDQAGCDGNFSCWCLDANCTQASAVCIENCGVCPGALDCEDITVGDGTGAHACLDAGNIPADAQTGCQGGDCNGNAGCWCLDQQCAQTVCLFNCSVPH
jgi:hypothetical protein